MRKWQAIPVAVVTGLLAGLVLFSASPATTYAGSSPPFAMRVDCDTATAGVQAACTLPAFPGQTTLNVNVVFDNNNGAATTLAAFNFDLYDPDKAVINPSSAPARNTTTLPDGTASWACTQPVPVADTGSGAAGTATSAIGCIDNNGLGVSVPVSLAPVASLTYAVLQDGVVTLVLSNVAEADENGVTNIGCDPAQSPPAAPGTGGNPVIGPCFGATIQIGASAATSTPTNTPTQTPPPTATPTPCQTGCPTATTLAFATVTPNSGTQTATAPTAVPATAAPAQPGGSQPGQPSGNTPGGAPGAGGSGPIRLPDTGAGSDDDVNWTSATLLVLLALAVGGAAGAMYLGAVHVSASRRNGRG